MALRTLSRALADEAGDSGDEKGVVTMAKATTGRWPKHMRPGALRWARASDHYDETIAFYRDLIGLPVVDEFAGSYGENGTIFGLPDTGVQMEIVRAHHGGPSRGAFDQLVFYLADTDAVALASRPLSEGGLSAVPVPHDYWAANGAVVYRDPDGRDVVFAPWVYGRDPEPADENRNGG